MDATSDRVFVDAHCHVDLFKNPIEIARACQSARIHTIAVTNAPSVYFYTEQLASKNDFLHPAIGLHPELCRSHHQEIAALLEMIPKVRCVGEVGLDYVEQDRDIRTQQRAVLTNIVQKCAEVGGKLLSVHSRRAASDTIAIIGNEFPGHVVMHWFSGSAREARRAIDNGYYFSVNCAMARSENGRRILKELPPERVITESDAPFLECCGQRDAKQFAHHTLLELSQLWGCSAEDARSKIYENFARIFPKVS